jgi:hypothetical protein
MEAALSLRFEATQAFEKVERHKRLHRRNFMSTLVRSLILAAAVFTSASAAMAAPHYSIPDQSDKYGGYAPNSQEGQRAFWDNQARRGN